MKFKALPEKSICYIQPMYKSITIKCYYEDEKHHQYCSWITLPTTKTMEALKQLASKMMLEKMERDYNESNNIK